MCYAPFTRSLERDQVISSSTVPEVRRIQYEDRIYVDLEDMSRLCKMMSDLHLASGMVAGALVMEDVARALTAMT